MLEIGKAYYVMAHAYHHFLGVVVSVTPSKVKLKDCVRVYSCPRGWEEFFEQGLKDDTECQRFPDGSWVNYDIAYFPWDHATLPKSFKLPRR